MLVLGLGFLWSARSALLYHTTIYFKGLDLSVASDHWRQPLLCSWVVRHYRRNLPKEKNRRR